MERKAAVVLAFLGLMVGTASAQTVTDVRSVLEASLKAMGGANLKTIRYSASGWSSRIGQTYGLAEDWPHYEVADYTRMRSTTKPSGRARTTRAGRAAIHFSAGHRCRRARHVHSERQLRWDMQGDKPVPLTSLYLDGVSYADLRQLELAITPHGFLKAALAAKDATAITLPIVGSSDAGPLAKWAQE
jgi:hypothetical protein